MKTYEVTAWCDLPQYTTFDVKARSLKAALAKAKTQVYDETPEPCNGGSYDWNEIQVQAPNGKSIRYLTPEWAAEIAAKDLLEAAIHAEEVLSELARLDDGTPSVSALSLLRAAIAKATQQ
jgi:hypothetical protein